MMDTIEKGFSSDQLRQIADYMDAIEEQDTEIIEDSSPTTVVIRGPIDVTLLDSPEQDYGQIEFMDELILFHPVSDRELDGSDD